ncbi:MAG: redoxin domain-containing protein, partial [Chitinophagaceae bacterium]|nr:redoxin domain-containing protein [Chitinophagaceae bacterium]
MKNLIIILIAFFSFTSASAQYEVPPYKKDKNIPMFELLKVDNSVWSSAKLKKNQPVTIIFFSPVCEHCIHQFEDMVKNMKSLKNVQIVMATYQPIEELAEFNKKYNIAKYTNIVTGRDANYFLPPFYRVTNFPYFAFYDKNGKFKSVFEGNLSVEN